MSEKGKGFIAEFKEFALKGSVVDLAVGVIIGAAFQTIVNSLVNDIIMPFISAIFKVNFESWKWVLKEAVLDADGVTVLKEAISVNYGTFIGTIINFIILALVIFLMVKAINKARSLKKTDEPEEEPEAEPEPTAEEVLLTEIRDLLKEKK
ncbi:MAG: large-conductance mechanosensitive channel protein MscL [Oscillospiraceae bacterium]|nr:large-conductance mechanosensitive channel protein MscL [Oscillospiraceae bacterium]